MTDDDLISRLRNNSEEWTVDAADLIEAQQAEIERLEKQVKQLTVHVFNLERILSDW